MPIRINLLAEQLAAEEARRRDPVKRATWVAGFVVALVVIWGGVLQTKIMRAGSRLTAEQEKLTKLDKESRNAANNLKRTGELERKLAALQTLATNRFLWATTLNALQTVMVDNVQVMRIRGEQSYGTVTGKLSEKEREANPKAKPPESAQEKIALIIEAKDFGNPADLNYNRFISEIGSSPVFKKATDKADGITLRDRMPAQPDPADPRRQFIQFSIECRYPEKLRTL